MRSVPSVIAILGLLAVSGCASAGRGDPNSARSSSAAVHKPDSRGHISTLVDVSGLLVMEGGPSGANGPRPIPGLVWFSKGRRIIASVRVSASGRFALQLADGSYQVSAKSPRILEQIGAATRETPCAGPTQVTVSGTHRRIVVACIVP